MTFRFSGANPPLKACLDSRRARAGTAPPANDNAGAGASDAMLHAALRHFAQHGLAAAQRARRQAEAALSCGDRQGYRWWLDICRILDRRMAAAVAARARS